jgi:hypothetical protein
VIRLPPPLRFLVSVVGLWAGLRAAVLAPDWWPIPAEPAAAEPVTAAPAAAAAVVQGGFPPPEPAASVRQEAAHPRRPPDQPEFAVAAALRVERVRFERPPAPLPERPVLAAAAPAAEPDAPLSPPALARPPAERRWAVSAWAFWRRGDGGALASGGALGGSQAGARATYRLGPALDLSLRLAAPIRRAAGAEAMLGMDWKPIHRLPIHLLGERRQALGRDGRSAFQVTAYGGIDDLALGRLRVDGYAQAGLVGLRRRDGFVDGAVRLSLPVRGLKLGAGAWAAAQPGVARFDAGPQVSLRLRLGKAAVTVSSDWRMRVAGNARPDSGPALTLATGF